MDNKTAKRKASVALRTIIRAAREYVEAEAVLAGVGQPEKTNRRREPERGESHEDH